jgi:LysR family transcriptional regulator, transcriptional activator for dmlA
VLDQQQLQTFVSIAQAGSIAAGARTEAISPSLASRRIAALEAVLGVRLFQRTTRKFQITEAGSIVLAWARESIRHYAQLRDELGAQQEKPVGLIRIACNEFTGSRYVLQTIVPFRARNPEVRFQVRMVDEPIQLVDEGFDLVIHAGRLPDGNLVGRRVRSYQRILCGAPAYFERHGVPETLEDLGRHDCLTHARSEPRNWFFRQGEGPIITLIITPAVEANAYLLLVDLALAGAGIIRISAPMVNDHIEAGRLRQILGGYQCVNPDGQLPGFWLIQPDRHMPYRVRLFADHLIRHLRLPP